MDISTIIEQAKSLLVNISADTSSPEADRLDIIIPADKLVAAAKALQDNHWGYLSAITGLDHSPSNIEASDEREWAHIAEDQEQTGFGYHGSFEVLYHYCNGPVVLTLRVQLPHQNPKIASICASTPSATLFERELIEMFGIEVNDTPDDEHLLLPDDWPVGVYPLRKEFTGFEEKGSDHDAE